MGLVSGKGFVHVENGACGQGVGSKFGGTKIRTGFGFTELDQLLSVLRCSLVALHVRCDLLIEQLDLLGRRIARKNGLEEEFDPSLRSFFPRGKHTLCESASGLDVLDIVEQL